MKFSIITVCLNSAKTIKRTFDSLLEQQYTDYEYIVIDGLSQDGTVEIIKEYEPKFQGRMHWISEKDNGLYDAMNKGIALAKGDYINIMNSDDWFEKDALASIAKISGKPDVIYGCVFLVDPIWNTKDLERTDHHRLFQKMIAHQGCFIAKTVHKTYGGYNNHYRVSGDYDFFLKIYLAGVKIQETETIVANFQRGGASSNIWVSSKENFLAQYKNGIISRTAMWRGIFSSRILFLIEKMFIKMGKIFFSLRKKTKNKNFETPLFYPK